MKFTALMTCLIYLFATTAYAASGAYECLNDEGKLSKCDVTVKDGTLIMDYDKDVLDKDILGKKIKNLAGGEYARRRVAESIGFALINPLALFGLFSKKKRDIVTIQYVDKAGNADATMIQMKKKYSQALNAKLEAISGLKIEYKEVAEKKK